MFCWLWFAENKVGPMKKSQETKNPQQDQFLTLPNILTLMRLALVPVFLVFSLRRQAGGALLVFSAAGLTDFLDGITARVFHLRTRIGSLLDPLADKVLISTAFLILTFRDPGSPFSIPLWLTVCVLGRDFIILSGAWIIRRTRGYKIFLPSWLGKINTVFQVLTVFLVLFRNFILTDASAQSLSLSHFVPPSLPSTFFLLTFVSTVLSGIQYIFRGATLFFSPRLE